MSKFRDKTYKYIMVLGALFFLFISSSTQACVLADHDCANPVQVIAPAQADLHSHAAAPEKIGAQHDANHLSQISHQETDHDCCHLIPADLGDFAQAQVSNPSSQQFSSDWFHLQLANAFSSSFYSFRFAQREIISPPCKLSSVVSLCSISSLNAGRAPPSAVLV